MTSSACAAAMILTPVTAGTHRANETVRPAWSLTVSRSLGATPGQTAPSSKQDQLSTAAPVPMIKAWCRARCSLHPRRPVPEQVRQGDRRPPSSGCKRTRPRDRRGHAGGLSAPARTGCPESLGGNLLIVRSDHGNDLDPGLLHRFELASSAAQDRQRRQLPGAQVSGDARPSPLKRDSSATRVSSSPTITTTASTITTAAMILTINRLCDGSSHVARRSAAAEVAPHLSRRHSGSTTIYGVGASDDASPFKCARRPLKANVYGSPRRQRPDLEYDQRSAELAGGRARRPRPTLDFEPDEVRAVTSRLFAVRISQSRCRSPHPVRRLLAPEHVLPSS
jgi:hypothetical protein